MIEDGNLDWFYKGVEYVHANLTIKNYLKTVTLARLAIVNRAFSDVYGKGVQAPPTDAAFWNAKFDQTNQLYKEVVNAETKKLNAPDNGAKFARRVMITAAYKRAMGRVPTKDDMAYWEPRTEIYKKIIAASRDWLYSTNGAKDLAETVTRSLELSLGKKPSIEQVNDAMLKYAKTKAIYDEMK